MGLLDTAAGASPWGAIIGGGIGLAKGLFGMIQASKANKQMNSLLNNRPQYQISQGYLDAYNNAKTMASSQMPGYDQMLGQIGESTAKTMDYARQGALGSNQYMDAALKSQDKELSAVQNLGIMSAQWKSQQQQALMGEQNKMGGLQDTQWQQNVLDPYNMKLNMAVGNKQSGVQNAFSGLQDIGSALNNYLGTNAYMQALQGMNKQNNVNAGTTPQQPYSVMGGGVNPQQNLLNTLQQMRPAVNPVGGGDYSQFG